MAVILPVEGVHPDFGTDCFLAPNATVVGDVRMGNGCSIWFNAVVRGDVNAIRMGDRVNVQDGAVLHCTYLKTQVHIGNNVSIGHNAIVHGCRIEDNVLIGMGAIIMDNAVIGSNGDEPMKQKISYPPYEKVSFSGSIDLLHDVYVLGLCT